MCVFASALSLSYFILNKRTGFLIIKENAPTGTYQFQIRVSDGVWPDAISSVTVHVRELRDEAIYNSGSLRLAGESDAAETCVCVLLGCVLTSTGVVGVLSRGCQRQLGVLV